MTKQDQWTDKRVLITGGSSGLGEALSRELVDRGAKVAIVARHSAGIARLLADCPRVAAIRADVSKADDVRRIVSETYSALGGVDALVNNASTLGATPLRLLVDTENEDFERVLQTNLLGPFRLTQAILPDMLLRGDGLVVNISSDAAVQAYPGWGAYGASKAGLNHLTRIFDEELSERGVRFLFADPGDMKTPMHFAAIPDADPDSLLEPAVSARKILALAESAL